MSDPKKVRYYFAYNSPYAFLANTRLVRELADFNVALEYKPVYSPRTGGPPDFESPRFRYIFEDVARFAEAYGLEMNPGPLPDTQRACLGLLWALENGTGVGYHDAIFRARWLEGKDLGEDATLAAAADAAGLDGEALVAALGDPRWAATLEQHQKDAEADGVFGVPFFVYEGKHFWGNDRIEWLVRELQKR